MDRKSLVIVQHNIQSLKSKSPFVCELLSSLNIDILILNETWLKTSDSVKIKGYQIFRNDSDTGYGGVAIVCKKSLICSQILTESSDRIQSISISVKINHNKCLTVLGIYCPPRAGRFPVNTLKNIVTSLPSPVLVMGDFNAHHTAFGSSSDKARGIQIYDMLDEIDMYILNDGQPTTLARPNQSPSAIDIAFVSPILASSIEWSVHTEDTLGSYHFPTIVNLNTSSEIYESPSTSKKFLYNKANWLGFTLKSKNAFNHLLDNSDPISCYDEFCDLLNSLKAEFIPVHQLGSINQRKIHKPMPWWNETCSNAVKECKLALHMYRRYPTMENYILYKKLEASKKLTIKQQKVSSWKKLCSSFDRNTPISNIWKFIKIFNRKCCAPKSKDDEFLADFLNKVAPDQPPVNTNHLDHLFQCNDLNTHLNSPFSEAEFNLSLNSRRDTSPGLDDIPYILIKRLDASAKSVLLKIFNDLWLTGEIPSSWKTIVIVPILKPDKDPKSADSYRPISLSSCVGKIFENMLKTRLELYAESRSIIPHDQFGFRKGRSTIDSLLKFTGDIQESFCENSYLISTFLDVSGAFDNVDLPTLVEILHCFNIPGKVSKWIFNFFYSRTVFLKFNSVLHGPKIAYKGVPQGATLSPLIYLLYTSELHRFVSVPRLSVLQYADDIVLYTSNRNLLLAELSLNEALRQLYLYYKVKLKLDVNPTKSTAMIFSKKIDFHDSVNIVYSSVNIQLVDEKRFLGIIFDSKLIFQSHVYKIVDKMQKSINIMRHLASVSWGMDPKILNMLFKSIVRSHYDYGLVVYGKYISKFLYRKLEVMQNKGLRLITGAFCSTPINSLEIEAGIPPVLIRLRYLTEKLYIKILGNKMYLDLFQNNSLLQCEHLNNLKQICKCIDHRENWALSTVEIQTMIPKVCTKKISNNTEFVEFVNNEKPRYRKVYTDGSKTDRNTKAAYYDSKVKFGRCFTLDQNASIFTAEAYAIYAALQYIRGINTDHSFLIVTDSLSVLTCLENIHISYKTNIYITKIREILLESEDKEIEFMWVPSHSGITGNEIVDSLMKIQHPSIDNLQYLAPAVPITDYGSILKARMFDHWHEDWEETKVFKGNWYAQIQKCIPRRPWYFKLKSPSRKYITTINRLRLGHGRFSAHLKRIKVIASDECEFCNSDVATLDHLFLQCPAFTIQRLLLVDGLLKIYKNQDVPRLLPSILENEDSYQYLFEYITSTFQEI